MCKTSNELGLTTNIKVWKLVSATGGETFGKKKNIHKVKHFSSHLKSLTL